MSLLERLGEELAHDALLKAKASGNSNIVEEISKAIGDTSTTLQESYLTAVRIFRAEMRAREVLDSYDAGSQAPPSGT